MEQKDKKLNSSKEYKIEKGKEVQGESAVKWNWKLLPLQFVVTLLPLIMYLCVASSGYAIYPWHSENDAYVDVFLQGKIVVFMAVAVVTLALVVLKLVKMEARARKQGLRLFIPLFIYAVFVILSTVCSKNTSYSLYGSMDAKEPVLVLLGYVIVAFYAYLTVETLEDVKQLVTAAVIGSALMALTGVLQAIGMDPFTSEGIQSLFVKKEFIETYGYLKLTFPKGMAYVTLFNPNYVGTYVAMNVPLVVVGIAIYKKNWQKGVCGVVLIGLLILLFASQSRTGLIAVIAVAAVLIIFLFREILKRWYIVLPGAVLLVLLFFGFNAYKDNLWTNRLKEMFLVSDTEYEAGGIDTTGNGVRVLYKDTEFTVMMPVSDTDFAYIVLEGEERKEIVYEDSKEFAYFILSNGEQITIRTAWYEDAYAFGLELNGQNFYFTNQIVVGNYKYINMYGRLDECVIPENVLPGMENLASGRGYVWGRAIPLLKDNLIVGSGPDTFGIEFPQNDYVARYKIGIENVVYTRPHNLYLQIGVQTGVVSLVSFLMMMVLYLVGSCKRFFVKKFTVMEQWFGLAIFLSTVGFLVAGLANDSMIVVTPIFYVLFGVGMAINHKFCPVVKSVSNKSAGAEEASVEDTGNFQAGDLKTK